MEFEVAAVKGSNFAVEDARGLAGPQQFVNRERLKAVQNLARRGADASDFTQ